MEETTLYYAEFESPIGPLLIINDGNSMLRIDYGTLEELEKKLLKWANRYFKKIHFLHYPETCIEVIDQLKEYFKGKRKTFTFEKTIYGTDFQKMVWEKLSDGIPYGETKTYKEIGEMIDNPAAVRAIGRAVNKNPFSIVIPCHRVIGSNGKLIGYNGGLDKKKFLLNHEQTYKNVLNETDK